MNIQDTHPTIYHQGEFAALEKRSKEECPYVKDSIEYQWWIYGYDNAKVPELSNKLSMVQV